jgi:hypothetical protein
MKELKTIAKIGAAEENISKVSLIVQKTCKRVSTEGSGRKILRTIGTVDMSVGVLKNQLEGECYYSHRNKIGYDHPNVYTNQK